MSKVVVYKPNRQSGRFDHIGDTFRELLDLWEEYGLVEIKKHNGKYVWLNDINDVLLYDRPTYEWLGVFNKYTIGLFGNNPCLEKMNHLNQTDSSWIFWSRHPRQLDEHKNLPLSDRTIKSIFIGKIENNIQQKHRRKFSELEWKKHLDVFELPNGASGHYKYSQKEYLDMISKSKYGLCLRGYGPKCNREIELFRLGVVPLITEDVDMTYYDRPIENVHYFKIKEPSDVSKIVRETPDDIWQSMSDAGRKWYIENASPKGSFDTTMKIVKECRLKRSMYSKPKSLNTLATDNSIKDLRLLLKSLRKFEPGIRLYLICDTMIYNNISIEFDDMHIKYRIALDKYSGKNRKQMESENIWNTFMRVKLDAIRFALETESDTLHVDSDILFLDTVPYVDVSKKVGLCPHFVKKFNVNHYGYYNAGFIYTNSMMFVDWWDIAINRSKFYDQGCLEEVPEMFSYFEFDMTVDFGWWRLFECDDPQERIRKLNVDQLNKCVTYGFQRLNSVHTHFQDNDFPYTVKFSTIIKNLMDHCGDTYKDIFIDTSSKACVNVLCQYYNDSDEERQHEIDMCFLKNYENEYVKNVYHFHESKTKIPDKIKNNKLKTIDFDFRLTYKRAIDFANQTLKGELVCICNTDIFLDKSSNWVAMKSFLNDNPGYVYALSRHEYDGNRVFKDETLQRLAYANSQDAWFFIAPMKMDSDIDFLIGTLGCDNAIADRFQKSGYVPINSPNEYKIIHFDVCRKKTGKNFLKFSKNYEKQNQVQNDHPEKRGQRLCPDIDTVSSVDNLMNQLKLDKFQRYEIICDVFSKYIKINNDQ